MNTTDKLAEALRLAREWFRHEEAGEGPQAYDVIKAADEAIAAYEAEQAAKAVPAGLYVGLIERLMRLSTRLGIADGDSVEHFAASLEDRLYAICRSAESLLDSLAPAAPAPEAQAAGQELPPLPEPDGTVEIDCGPAPGGGREIVFEDGYSADQMHAYARAALAQHQPLTDERILAMVKAAPALKTAEAEWLHVARAIERAHGIGGATTGEQ